MGKTFRRNEGRRPKWDKRGNKSHKQRDFEDDWNRGKNKWKPSPPEPQDPIDYDKMVL